MIAFLLLTYIFGSYAAIYTFLYIIACIEDVYVFKIPFSIRRKMRFFETDQIAAFSLFFMFIFVMFTKDWVGDIITKIAV